MIGGIRHASTRACLAIVATSLVQAASAAPPPAPARALRPRVFNPDVGGKVVVANRGSGTVTVISTATDAVIATLALPAADNPPEPMYVNYSAINDSFLVGDRANDRVVAYDAQSFQVVGSAPAGAGVFHMWNNDLRRQLWVNNDVDNTTTVIDLRSMTPIATVDTPADLVAAGGKPHDVILSPEGLFAYVTVIGVAGGQDYVVRYSTQTYTEVDRVAVGGDPHVSLTIRNRFLYVPCQDTSEVYVFDRYTMQLETVLSVPGAHGAGMRFDGRYFYTTNLPGGGSAALWTIDTDDNEVVGGGVDAPFPVPHNITLTPLGDKLYVTHSGANNKVSVYRARGATALPVLVGDVTTGDNPFGLAWVP